MSKHRSRHTSIGGGGLNARRIALMVSLVLAVAAAVVPVFLFQKAADARLGDPAYQALATYALAHNGDHSLDGQAAKALPTLTRTDLGGGREQLVRLSSNGETCWVVVVESGRASAPRKGVLEDCTAPPIAP